MVKGGGHHTSSHQPADVGHVSHEIGTVGIGDLPHAGIVQVARVAADTCREMAHREDRSRCSRTLGQTQVQPCDGDSPAGDSTQAPASVDVFEVSSWHCSIRGLTKVLLASGSHLHPAWVTREVGKGLILTCYNQLGVEEAGVLLQTVIVNVTGLGVDLGEEEEGSATLAWVKISRSAILQERVPAA